MIWQYPYFRKPPFMPWDDDCYTVGCCGTCCAMYDCYYCPLHPRCCERPDWCWAMRSEVSLATHGRQDTKRRNQKGSFADSEDFQWFFPLLAVTRKNCTEILATRSMVPCTRPCRWQKNSRGENHRDGLKSFQSVSRERPLKTKGNEESPWTNMLNNKSNLLNQKRIMLKASWQKWHFRVCSSLHNKMTFSY